MKAAHIMTRNVISVQPETTIAQAAELTGRVRAEAAKYGREPRFSVSLERALRSRQVLNGEAFHPCRRRASDAIHADTMQPQPFERAGELRIFGILAKHDPSLWHGDAARRQLGHGLRIQGRRARD